MKYLPHTEKKIAENIFIGIDFWDGTVSRINSFNGVIKQVFLFLVGKNCA